MIKDVTCFIFEELESGKIKFDDLYNRIKDNLEGAKKKNYTKGKLYSEVMENDKLFYINGYVDLASRYSYSMTHKAVKPLDEDMDSDLEKDIED